MTQQTQTKQLPKGWKEIPLSEVLDYEQPNDYIVNNEILVEETPIPVLTANKGFIKGYTKETDGIYRNIPVIIFDDFTADNKFVNFPFKVKSSAMKILKIKDKNAHLKYIFYQMQLKQVDTGTHKRYYLSTYQNLDFLFPINKDNAISLQGQQLIVSEIEKQFSRLDETIKSLKSVKDKLRIYRKTVLKKAFEKKDGWGKKRLDSIVKTIDGDRGKNYPKKSEYLKQGYCLFLSTKNVRQNGFLFEDKLFISKEKDELLRGGKLERGDIIITTRGTLGNIAIYNQEVPFENVRINSGMLILRIKDENLNNLFLSKFLTSPFFTSQIEKNRSGTAQPQIPANVIKQLIIFYPESLREQQAIVQKIESKSSIIDKVEEIVNQSLIKAEKLKKSILKSAFEGRLIKFEGIK